MCGTGRQGGLSPARTGDPEAALGFPRLVFEWVWEASNGELWDLEREGVALMTWPSLVVRRLQGHRKPSSLQTLLPSGPGDVP